MTGNGAGGPGGGHVYVVGAGPGDPELLTLRAAAILARADVVFHDRLVSPGVLAMVRPGAALVDVGHRSGQPRLHLEEIARRMAAEAARGLTVCRLKGGDPYVFGRGGEDVRALLSEGVCCEVVPGVSSAIAGPGAAGIPVTLRGVASSFVVVTGHDRSETPDWRRLRADTVVVLMGSARVDRIAADMIAAGWDADTPAAIVMAATTAEQRHVIATLNTVDGQARTAGLGSPALLVVGHVVCQARSTER